MYLYAYGKSVLEIATKIADHHTINVILFHVHTIICFWLYQLVNFFVF